VICPNCNGDVPSDAKFCRLCGSRLADPISAATPPVGIGRPSIPEPPQTPDTPSELPAGAPPQDAIREPGERRGHRRLLLAALAVVVLAIAAAVVALADTKTSVKHARAQSARSSTPAATPTTTVAQTPLLGTQEVEHVLAEYSAAYSAENYQQLATLLSPTLVRRNGTDRPEDRVQAIKTYRDQFSQLRNPRYTLSNMRVVAGHGQATITANYAITSQNGTIRSPITFHVVSEGTGVEIDRISIPQGR
jgi:hypothetical protein